MRRLLRFLLFLLLYLAWFSIVTTGQTNRPRLLLSASPLNGISPFNVRLRAEIAGDITEEWSCPEIVWTLQEGTADERKSSTMEMCHEDSEPPRVWTKSDRVSVVSEEPVDVVFRVSLLRDGKTLASKTITIRAVGGRPREWDQ